MDIAKKVKKSRFQIQNEGTNKNLNVKNCGRKIYKSGVCKVITHVGEWSEREAYTFKGRVRSWKT